MDRIEEPLNERSRRTRRAVLEAAWNILEDQGVAHLSMLNVAQSAGVSRRAIYLHFASRSELLIALHAHIDEALDLEASLKPVFEASDSMQALKEWANHVARYHPQLMNVELALDQARRTDADVATLWKYGEKVWYEGCLYISGWLEREGMLAEPWTAETAADLLWTFMTPQVVEHLTVSRAWTPDEFGSRLKVLLERTLVRREATASAMAPHTQTLDDT